MKIINFNEKNIIEQIGQGIESEVFLYNDDGTIVAFKRFKSPEEIETIRDPLLLEQLEQEEDFSGFEKEKIFLSNDNKELKLKILRNEQSLKKDIKLLNRVYHMGKFIGFTSVYEPYDPISFINGKKRRIQVLEALQSRYEELNKHGIYIGDFNQNNIAMTNNGIKLYDIDNFRIDSIDFNVTDSFMRSYQKKCDNIQNIDYYCFNYFALSYLASYTKESVINGIAFTNFPNFLKTPEVMDFVDFLENMDDNTVIEKTKDGKPKTLLNILK